MTATILPFLRPLTTQGRERAPGVNETSPPGAHQAGSGGNFAGLPLIDDDVRAYMRWLTHVVDDITFDEILGSYDPPSAA